MFKITRSLAVLTIMLSACSGESDQGDARAKARADEAAIAVVEAAQTPPPQPVKLSAITFPDVERENLFGAGCNFAPAGGGMGAVAMAQGEAGYLKIDNKVVRFAPDAGSGELFYGARQKYTGTTNSFELTLEEEGKQSGYEVTDYSGRLVVRDSVERVVYDAKGLVQCGA
jgi:hypothetical protein